MAALDFEILGLALALLFWVTWAMTTERRHRRKEELGQLPPGPRPWPVVGNLFQLSLPPHVSFARLAAKHGPIMTVWLGSMCTIVISSSDVAREMFKHHDVVLAGRKIYETMKGNRQSEGSIIAAQYGPHWRMLRRLYATEFFTTTRLDAMRDMRESCVNRLVLFVEEAGSNRRPVDIGRFIFLMAFNLMANLMLSRDLVDPASERGARFFNHARAGIEWAAKPNAADFFPVLRRLDPQGIRRKALFHIDRAFEIAGEFIEERAAVEVGGGEGRKDLLDVLLKFRGVVADEPASFSPTTINVMVFEMFTAGTDTTTSTLEWAMAELMHNPRTLSKVQTELRTAIDPNKRKLQEQETEHLPYLKAVIKETLRLHPPLPFLVPHMALTSCNMLGYHIPKGTQILVNAWAIGRDGGTWKDPLMFRPERFMEGGEATLLDYKGQHFEYIPFGSGRRMCPAVPLASRVLPLALGSLLYNFDWVLPDGVNPDEMDMSERMGVTIRKAVPLKIIPIPYNRKGTE